MLPWLWSHCWDTEKPPTRAQGALTALKAQQSKFQGTESSQRGWRWSWARRHQRIWLLGELPAAPRAHFGMSVCPRGQDSPGRDPGSSDSSRAGGQEEGKAIPVPFVLQLQFQPRERLGGSEFLFNSDHAELLPPRVTNSDCWDHPGVTTRLWGVLCPFPCPQTSSLPPGELLQGISETNWESRALKAISLSSPGRALLLQTRLAPSP